MSDTRSQGGNKGESENKRRERQEQICDPHQERFHNAASVLSANVFPRGKKELCIESDVIVVSPERVTHIVTLLRRSVITLHARGMSLNERATKITKLYKLITSEKYAQQFHELEGISADIQELDGSERKSHETVWRKRGGLVNRITTILRDIDTEVAAIVEGQEPTELSVAS